MNGSQNMHWLFLTLMKLMVTTLILATVFLSLRQHSADRREGNKKKKRHSTKKARTRQKNQVNSNTRNKQKSQVFHATARQRNSAKASWLVRPFSGFLASPNELSIETIEQKIVHIIADNALECGAESHLVHPFLVARAFVLEVHLGDVLCEMSILKINGKIES